MRVRDIFSYGLFAMMLVAAVAFQNCSPVEFKAPAQGDIASVGDLDSGPSPQPTPQTICDPFDQGNVVDPKSGIEGRIYYTGDRLAGSNCAAAVCTSRDYISKGTMVKAELFLQRLFVPARNFTQGFNTNGNQVIADGNGNPLIEWFALDMNSNFSLLDSDDEGLYQFATISDDGVTLTVNGENILEGEGEHAPELNCSSKAIELKKGQLQPFRLSYFQGPRDEIALVMLWRKRDPGQSLGNCGTSNGELTSADNLPLALESRGWKVVPAGNFKVSGYNKCANQP